MVCSPGPVAEDLFEELASDVTLPDLSGIVMPTFPDLDPEVWMDTPSIKMEDLTEGRTGGSGVFDKLMTSVTAHLDRERQAGRVTNNDFAKTYVEFSTGALGAAIQFLLQKDQAHWQAITAQAQAKIALVSLVQAEAALAETKLRVAMMAYQAEGAKAQTALVKMNLATAKIEYCTAEYQLENILPKEALNLTAQKSQIEATTNNITQTTTTLLPEQVRGAKAQADTGVYQLTYIMPLQKDQLSQQLVLGAEQIKVTKEQLETQRAQTLDTRSDGVTPVAGTLGKQKDVQTQQIQSYKQDAQLKAARPFIDAWITMKTIDEGTLPPDNFNNANLNAILGLVRDFNDLR